MYFLKKIIENLLIVLFKFLPIKKNFIVIEYQGLSGSNLIPIANSIVLNSNYSILILSNYSTSFISKITNKIFRIYFLSRARLILTSHSSSIKLKKNQLEFNLWHGFPLKGMGNMDKLISMKKAKKIPKQFSNIDYMLSLSSLSNTMIGSCFFINRNKFVVLGYPRNDYLFNSNGKKNLGELGFDLTEFKHVFLYMPTYRDLKQDIDSIFNLNSFLKFDDYSENTLINFLKKNNILLLLKLHPNDEKNINLELMRNNKYIRVLTTSKLINARLDLYEILNSISLLITDYSSVYFDWLLINKPILFVSKDLKEYKGLRGLLIENYDFWTPGEKAENLSDFMRYSLESIYFDIYSKDRNNLKKEIHRFVDGESTKRVIDFIQSIM